MKTQADLLSYYYCCQQKKHLLTKSFERAQSVDERHYWIKQINKNDIELDALKNLISDYRLDHSDVEDHPPQYRY